MALLALLPFAWVEVGSKRIQEGKAVIQTSCEALDGARQNAGETIVRTEQTNEEAEKIWGDEKKWAAQRLFFPEESRESRQLTEGCGKDIERKKPWQSLRKD
jgi:hypothetical protein